MYLQAYVSLTLANMSGKDNLTFLKCSGKFVSMDVVATCVVIKVNGGLTSNASEVWRSIQLKEGRLVGTSLVAYIKASGVFKMY